MQKSSLKSFKDLNVWQKATDLAVLIYITTEQFPHSELYGITNQMRRSAISISSNIAEGFKRSHKGEKSQFYNIAYGSSAELESQIEISYKLTFLSKTDYEKLSLLTTEISKMMDGLIRSLHSKSYILNPHSGYLLIELIVAMSVFTIGFLAVLGLTANAVSATRVITDSFTANYLAMEGIEVVKSIVDENALSLGAWNRGIANQCYVFNYNSTRTSPSWTVMACPLPGESLLDSGVDPLKFTPATGLYARQGGPVSGFSPFYRMVHVIPEGGSPRYIKLESVVAWIGRGGTRNEIVLEDYLFDQK